MNLNPNVPYASDFQSVLNYLINFVPGQKRPDKKVLAAKQVAAELDERLKGEAR